nr:MAG TPA: hypothetical protein [Caudoviricetes sp.]
MARIIYTRYSEGRNEDSAKAVNNPPAQSPRD